MSEFIFGVGGVQRSGESTSARILRAAAAQPASAAPAAAAGAAGPVGAAAAAAPAAQFSQQAFRSNQSVVFVDVGSRKVDSNVTRNGVPIGVLTTDPDILGGIIIDRPIFRVRVVSQSIPAGTPVPVGSAVDIVMAPPSQLNVGLIAGTLTALRDQNMDQAFQTFVAGNPQVDRIVARSAGGALSNEDEAAVRQLFLNRDIAITDQPGQDVTAAVETLRVLTAFGR
jgi:hypothetical protein